MASGNAKDPSRPPLPWERRDVTARVETPEQIEILFPIAPFGTRILAALLDHLLLGFANAVIILVLGLLLVTASDLRESAGLLLALYLVLNFILNTFYFVAFEVRGQGQTPGKRCARIRTIMDTGQGVTLGAALLRNLARAIDTLPPLWVVPALDKARRRLGDIVAQTLVVELERKKRPRVRLQIGDSYAELPQKEFQFTAEAYPRLGADDLNLLEYFFNETRHLLDSRRVAEISRDIAERYQRRLLLADQGERIAERPHRFLQELYLFLRDRYERRGF